MILDTSFVIAAERESRREKPGSALAFLAQNEKCVFSITFTVSAELACGRSASSKSTWALLTRPYRIIAWEIGVSWEYGEIYRQLSSKGNLIGTNDLWIAATARFHGLPVVTGNCEEFQRVEGLEVVGF